MTTKAGANTVKAHLSDYLNRAAYAGERIVVERHRQPVAALVSLNDLARLEATDHPPTPDNAESIGEAQFRSDMDAAGIMSWPTEPASSRGERRRIQVDGEPVSEQIVAERR